MPFERYNPQGGDADVGDVRMFSYIQGCVADFGTCGGRRMGANIGTGHIQAYARA